MIFDTNKNFTVAQYRQRVKKITDFHGITSIWPIKMLYYVLKNVLFMALLKNALFYCFWNTITNKQINKEWTDNTDSRVAFATEQCRHKVTIYVYFIHTILMFQKIFKFMICTDKTKNPTFWVLFSMIQSQRIWEDNSLQMCYCYGNNNKLMFTDLKLAL